tara:strand:+ start:174 stop:680 length:507 start_codon:yes stop_codon:yes gene_type:complete
MQLLRFIEAVEEAQAFQKWKTSHTDSYLVHIFFQDDKREVGYYNKDDTITTLHFEKEELKVGEEDQIFKKEEHKVLPLNKNEVKVEYGAALESAQELQKKNYSAHDPIKIICVLQHLEQGQVYNFTMITQSFQTLNVKVDAESGEIQEHKLYSLMDLGTVEPGKGGKA